MILSELDKVKKQVATLYVPYAYYALGLQNPDEITNEHGKFVAYLIALAIGHEVGLTRMIGYEKIRGVSLGFITTCVMEKSKEIDSFRWPALASGVMIWLIHRPYFELVPEDGGYMLQLKEGVATGPVFAREIAQKIELKPWLDPNLVKNGYYRHDGKQGEHETLLQFHRSLAIETGMAKPISEFLW